MLRVGRRSTRLLTDLPDFGTGGISLREAAQDRFADFVANQRTSLMVERAGNRSRVIGFGPTIVESKAILHFSVGSQNMRLSASGYCDGVTSVFDVGARASVPFWSRTGSGAEGGCGTPGSWNEASCGNCHVSLPPALFAESPEPSSREWHTLADLKEHGLWSPTGRLACQLPLTKAYDGVILRAERRHWDGMRFAVRASRRPSAQAPWQRGTWWQSKSARAASSAERAAFASGTGGAADGGSARPSFLDTFWCDTPEEVEATRPSSRFSLPPAPRAKYGGEVIKRPGLSHRESTLLV